jgi:hypothetical protein
MEKILGCQLTKFPLNLKAIADLIYFDGPLLSMFENKYGDVYFYYWCDGDENYNRWLVFRVAQKMLEEYIRAQISLDKLILSPADGFLYSLDIDDKLEAQNTCLIHPENLPDTYIPEADSYYDFADLNPATKEEDRVAIARKTLFENVYVES